jgi:D-alanyl-lipoteichoic acid acyltransferase DltB (MBOAT superfamily)
MITMVLGGLWHGASWNFVLWGALHGGALAATRLWQRASGGDEPKGPGATSVGASVVGRAAATFLTFHFVCFAWVFFRARTFQHATLALQQAAKGEWRLDHIAAKVALVIVAAMVLHFVPKGWEARLREGFVRTPAVAQGLLLAAVATALHLAAGAAPEPFVYGQF